VSLGRVFEKAQLSDVGYIDETLMVRRDGTVIASSDPDRKLAALPYTDVVEAIERGESGNVERDGKLITFTPLRNLESYFVAITDLDEMADEESPKAPVAAWASTATGPAPPVKPPAPRPEPPPEPEPEEQGDEPDTEETATPPRPPPPRPRPRPEPSDDDIEEKNPFERWENHP